MVWFYRYVKVNLTHLSTTDDLRSLIVKSPAAKFHFGKESVLLRSIYKQFLAPK